jgi:uncharacterized protein with GYD domain
VGQYIVLSRLTDEGRKTMKHNPARIFEVNRELESMGVHVREQFAVLGPYDFVTIIEAPDNITVMRASAEIGSRGSVEILMLPGITVDELVNRMK